MPQTDIDGGYGAAASVVEIAYALDPGQNRSSVTVTLSGQNPWTTPYTTEGDSPRYASIGGVTPLYDGEGNLAFDGAYYYVYDFKNRLAEVYVAVDDATQGMTAGASLSGSGTGTLSPSTASRITLIDLATGRTLETRSRIIMRMTDGLGGMKMTTTILMRSDVIDRPNSGDGQPNAGK